MIHRTSAKNISKRKIGKARTLTALVVSAVVLAITVGSFLAERGVSLPAFIPVCLHGVCPFGGVVTLGRLLRNGLYIPRTGVSNLFALAAGTGTTLFIGAFFCGWLCPLGAVQEWVRNLGKKLGIYRNKAGIPFTGTRARALDRALGYIRYITLFMILFMTYRSFNLVFASVDPYYALFHFWTGAAMPASLTILGLVLLLSLFVYRPWCRWFCPYGALQGLIQKTAPWKIRKNGDLCTSCGACDRACPMNINISGGTQVLDGRCNRCLSCLSSCPKEGALVLGLRRGRDASAGVPGNSSLTRSWSIALLVLVLFSLPLAAGSVYRHTQKQAVSQEQTEEAPEKEAVALSSALSLEETAELLGMEPSLLLELLGLDPAFDLSVKLRDLEEFDETKTFRWIRSRLEEFTQSTRILPEASPEAIYIAGNKDSQGGTL